VPGLFGRVASYVIELEELVPGELERFLATRPAACYLDKPPDAYLDSTGLTAIFELRKAVSSLLVAVVIVGDERRARSATRILSW
jgi:hypothetical protein